MKNKIRELKEFLKLVRIIKPRTRFSDLIKYEKGKLIYNSSDCMIEYKMEEKLFKKDCLVSIMELSFFLKHHIFFDIENIKFKGDFSVKEYTLMKCKKRKFYKVDNINSIIEYMIPFISKDKCRYYLTGIYFDRNILVATNGHHLIKNKTECKSKDFFILPTEICKLISKLDDDVEFCYDKKSTNVIFKNDKIKIISKTISGEYPNYEKVIEPYLKNKEKMSIEVKNYVFMNSLSIIDFDNNILQIKKDKEYNFNINHKMKGIYNSKYLKHIIEIAIIHKLKELSFNYENNELNCVINPIITTIDNNTLVLMPRRKQ